MRRALHSHCRVPQEKSSRVTCSRPVTRLCGSSMCTSGDLTLSGEPIDRVCYPTLTPWRPPTQATRQGEAPSSRISASAARKVPPSCWWHLVFGQKQRGIFPPGRSVYLTHLWSGDET